VIKLKNKIALEISSELMDWALTELNRDKARKLYKLSCKYKNIWRENNNID
jgi:hypothetical protein